MMLHLVRLYMGKLLLHDASTNTSKAKLNQIIMRHTYVRTIGKIMPSQSQLAFYTTFHASNINEAEQKLNLLHVQNIACIRYHQIVCRFKYQTAKY
jgi:hypothetical protein